MRAIAFVVAVVVLSLATPALAARTLAVLPLGKGAADTSYDGLGTALAGMLVSDLSTVEGLQLVERERLGDVLSELNLGKSGFLDPKTAQKLGKGLGSELVLTGSFSVVQERFLMDTRLVEVETGKILKATTGAGPAADFVAVEKDVVEKLLDGLEVQLSLAERRKLLLEAPTEDLEALSQYGIGVEAADEGDNDAAKKAFEAALREDPDFAQAALALADLKQKVQAAAATETVRFRTERERNLAAIIDAIPSEIERTRKFKDTVDSDIDLSIRLYLLSLTKQPCAYAAELEHYLVRRKGDFEWWVNKMPASAHPQRYELARGKMRARVAALHKRAGVPDKTLDPWDLMNYAGGQLSSPKAVLVRSNMNAEAFRDGLAGAVAACHDPGAREAKWIAIADAARRFMDMEAALYTTHNVGPSPETVEDAVRTQEARFRAQARGVDARVQQIADSLLARHPAGSPGHRAILSAIKRIVRDGEDHDRRAASRLGMSPEALHGAATAVRDRSAEALRMDNPLCAGLVERSEYTTTHSLESVAEGGRNYESRVDDLGDAIAPLVHARCFAASSGSPMTLPEVFAWARTAKDRHHPAANPERCPDLWEDLDEGATPQAEARALASPASGHHHTAFDLLFRVHSGRIRLCLVDE